MCSVELTVRDLERERKMSNELNVLVFSSNPDVKQLFQRLYT